MFPLLVVILWNLHVPSTPGWLCVYIYIYIITVFPIQLIYWGHLVPLLSHHDSHYIYTINGIVMVYHTIIIPYILYPTSRGLLAEMRYMRFLRLARALRGMRVVKLLRYASRQKTSGLTVGGTGKSTKNGGFHQKMWERPSWMEDLIWFNGTSHCKWRF
jgi:hypothetical protein